MSQANETENMGGILIAHVSLCICVVLRGCIMLGTLSMAGEGVLPGARTWGVVATGPSIRKNSI